MARSKKEPGTAIISVEELERQMLPLAKASAQALANAEQVRSTMNIIRTKHRKFSLGDETLKEPLRVVVLAQAAVQFYYEDEYDPDNPSSPVCYALAPDDPFNPDGVVLETKLFRAEEAPKKQSDQPCVLCPMNKPGSHPDGGWKRACQSRRRLGLLFVDDKSNDPQTGSIELSPIALNPWALYVRSLAGIHGVPFYMVVTELFFDEDKKQNWYVGARFGGLLTRARPEWLTPPKGVKIGSEGWLGTTLIGKKVLELAESKQLAAPPQQIAETPQARKRGPVTGKERVSVKELKKRRAATKKGRSRAA